MSEQPPIGVIGATGQQGGAVVDALLAAGQPVRALVRDPQSDRSRALADRGVEVVTGDQDQPETLQEPLTGLRSLFLMSTFTEAGGTEAEVTRATGVVDAAVRAGVPRIVYSSVGGAERHSGVPHFESKRRVEQYVTAKLPTVVVRPVYFTDNLAYQLDAGPGELVLRAPMPPDLPLEMVAVRDIGVVAAAALVDPAVVGESIEIAGDQLTWTQIAEKVAARLGRATRYEQVPLDSLGDDDLEAMFRWFVETPAYQGDFERTRAISPDVLDLDAWLARWSDAE